MAKAVIALGANLGRPRETFREVINELSATGEVLAVSRFIETKALVHPDDSVKEQPDYLNAACLVETKLVPVVLLGELQKIEKKFGRNREKDEKPWQPRTIDLDLICYDSLVVQSPTLTVPHPEMHKRDFVLRPMFDVWPDWVHPILGKSVRDMCADN